MTYSVGKILHTLQVTNPHSAIPMSGYYDTVLRWRNTIIGLLSTNLSKGAKISVLPLASTTVFDASGRTQLHEKKVSQTHFGNKFRAGRWGKHVPCWYSRSWAPSRCWTSHCLHSCHETWKVRGKWKTDEIRLKKCQCFNKASCDKRAADEWKIVASSKKKLMLSKYIF